MDTIGEKIILRREQLGISQRKLARQSGVSRSYIIEIEENKYKITVEILCKLSKALECTPNDLIPVEFYK